MSEEDKEYFYAQTKHQKRKPVRIAIIILVIILFIFLVIKFFSYSDKVLNSNYFKETEQIPKLETSYIRSRDIGLSTRTLEVSCPFEFSLGQRWPVGVWTKSRNYSYIGGGVLTIYADCGYGKKQGQNIKYIYCNNLIYKKKEANSEGFITIDKTYHINAVLDLSNYTEEVRSSGSQYERDALILDSSCSLY